MELGFLIDMDGVIYKGAKAIDGAVDIINHLVQHDVPFCFITNNSQKSRRDVALKLRKMGINAEDRHIFTCAMATARFLASQKPQGTAFVIGEGGLNLALHTNGYSITEDNPDYVVVGEGRVINFENLEKATQLVHRGAKLVATNLDSNCPVEDGIRPGCGAIVRLIEEATGVKAFSVGKPSSVMMRLARKQMNIATSQTVMIGDTMYTDILGGVEMGYQTVLVLSGGTTRSEVDNYSYRPNHIIGSIADLPSLFPQVFAGMNTGAACATGSPVVSTAVAAAVSPAVSADVPTAVPAGVSLAAPAAVPAELGSSAPMGVGIGIAQPVT